MLRSRPTAAVVLIAMGLVSGACGRTGTVTEPTTETTTTTTTTTAAVSPDQVVALYEGQADYVAAARADPQAAKPDLYRVHVAEPYWPSCLSWTEETDGWTPEEWSAFATLSDVDRLDVAVAALRDEDLTGLATDAVAHARTIVDGPPMTICLQAAYPTAVAYSTLDDAGGVLAVTGDATVVMVDPEAPDWQQRARYAIAREYCWIAQSGSWETGWPANLLDALVSVGKAHAFASIAEPGPASPQVAALTPEQEAALWRQRIGFQLDSQDASLVNQLVSSHPGPGVPLWAGHTIGYHIVQAYLAGHPDAHLAEWLAMDSATMLADSGYDPVAAMGATTTVDQAFLAKQADLVAIPESGGAFMVAVLAADGAVVHAARGTDPEGSPPTPDDVFRVGNITKLLTSLVTLTLVDEGLVDLDAPAVDYVSRVPVPEDVTVRDLLQHSSGIADYMEDAGLLLLRGADPGRGWTPEELVEAVAWIRPLFRPGSTVQYSNSNHIVLGVLIEEVTGRPFAQVLRARIIEPLGLGGTYLAGFEDGPEPFGAYASTSPWEVEPIDFDYTSSATMAGASGAVVTSALDLHALFIALFDGQVLAADTLAEMIGSPRRPRGWQAEYGLGIEVWNTVDGRTVEGLFGHGGHIDGYKALVLHAPETGMTAFWVATSDLIDPDPAVAAVAERVRGTD